MSVQELSAPREKSSLLTTGLALFSMFFGAGNLIFPLLIGKEVGGNVWFAIGGLGITAVLMPFLGLAAMLLFQADYRLFFGRLGKIPGMLLLLLLQLILGPLGVIPRLVTLMHATAEPYLFGMPLIWFSILMVALIFCLSFQRGKLINFLGAYLTPVLLLSLAALVAVGLISGSSMKPTIPSASESFLKGLVGGYQTMDLIAAFLFATVVLPHFRKEAQLSRLKEKSILKKMFLSSLIAAFLLFLTYVGLCFISAYHGWQLDSSSEQMLGAIAIKLLGPIGGGIAAIAVFTACLTTAMTLASIFADFLRKDLCKDKIKPSLALLITLAVTILFASLGFGGIAAFLSPILQIVYPGLIVLTLLNLLYTFYMYRVVKWPVFAVFGGSAFMYFFI
ncbi:MAG: branched-chain amino acid transport system II carrier protein [Verrucomicrobia bacterium]|nr:branched-chain amino acid transport system II carrier protein [Verrucomicrobiota bacterium]